MVLLYRKKENLFPNRILICLISVVVMHLGLVTLDVNGLFPVYPHLSRLSWLLPLLYGPLIFILTESIISPSCSFRPRLGLLFLPFVIYLLLLWPYFFSGTASKTAYLANESLVHQADFGWMNHLTNYLHIGFVLAAIVRYRSRARMVAEMHKSGQIAWLGQFLRIFMLILIFALITFYSKKYDWKYLSGIYPKHFLLAVLFIYWLGYKLLQENHKSSVAAPTTIAEPVKEIQNKYAKTGLGADTSKTIAASVTNLMLSQKPYLNSELSLTDLGEMLSMSKHQLSQVINSEFGMNFYEFVNGYRLERFKTVALSPENRHLSLLGIAFECGFNSKAAFNQFFKKKEGMTPTEYLKGLERKNQKSQA